jgi:hypothetical protein
MPDGPDYVHELVEQLAAASLFRFADEARKEIDGFFAISGIDSPVLLEQARALSYLHAAEFALGPAFADPGAVRLAPSEPLEVEAGHARLALSKGDCSLIIWTHAPANERIGSLSLWDMTVFSGDVSKLVRTTEARWTDDAADVGRLPADVERLESIYAESHWEPAAHPTMRAAVRRQGLLWRLKAAVVYDPDEGAVARAMAEFRRPTTA